MRTLRLATSLALLLSSCRGEAPVVPAAGATPGDASSVEAEARDTEHAHDSAHAQDPASVATESAPPQDGTYMGREIASLMRPSVGRWLVRESREEEEGIELLLGALALREGETVGEVGAGNGYMTVRLAEAVGTGGRVLAVDIQAVLLEELARRVAAAGLQNVEPILGAVDDPKLPAGSCDLVLVLDAYHEFSQPAAMLEAMRTALAPEGRLTIVEFRAEDPAVHPTAPKHKIAKDQLRREIEASGFTLVESYDELPQQHCLTFRRAD